MSPARKAAPRPRAKPATERQRQPTEIRRALIVDAARAVIADRGLFATTVRDIAHVAGVSAGTLSYHFIGIAEILREVLDGEMESFYRPIAERAAAAARGAEALQLLVDGFFADDERTRQHWRLWLDFWSLSAHDETYARWQRDTYRRWHADVGHALERGAADGDFVVPDLVVAMTDFMALFDGLAAQAYLPGAPLGPTEARAHLNGWVRRTLMPEPRPPRSARRRQS